MNGPDKVPPSAEPTRDESSDGKPYYILRRGEILGPFYRSSLENLVKEGRVEYDDFAQEVGDSDWSPLRWVLIPASAEDLEGALAPTWGTLMKWAWLRLRYNLDEKSLSAGWVCLGLALAGLFLSRWPVLLWAPWAVFAFFGGIALYRRDRTTAGISLMLAAALIPGALWAYFWTDSLSAARSKPAPVAEVSLPTPSPAAPNAPAPAIAIAALDPAPTVQAKATPVIAPPLAPPALPPAEMPAVPPPTTTAVAPIAPPQPEPAVLPLPPPVRANTPAALAPPSPFILPPGKPATDQLPPPTAPAAPATAPSPGASPLIPASMSNPANTVSAELAGIAARTVHHNAANLVFVSDTTTQSAGSGFICDFEGKPTLFTNIHVVAGMQMAKFTTLDQRVIQTVGAPVAAIGHDILRYSLAADAPSPRLRVATNAADVAEIGDEVFVLGNSEGARVITPLPGKITGLGPELIEVTAEFVPGNSGSPIIHAKSGSVIGIATYLSIRDKQWLSAENAQPKIRRFGYRLDSVKQWQALDWPSFAREKADFEKITLLTADLANLLRDMRDGVIQSALHTNAAISPHVRTYTGKVGGSTRVHQSDRMDAGATLMRFMRSASQQDIADLGPKIRYDYFQRQLTSERNIRAQFAEVFDDLLKQMK